MQSRILMWVTAAAAKTVAPTAAAVATVAVAAPTVAVAVTPVELPGGVATAQEAAGVQPEEAADAAGPLRRLPAFGALDTDEDGEISVAEIDAAPDSLASLDDDGDGRLSGDELRPPPPPPIGGPARTPAEATAAFLAFDADVDGALAGAELPSQFVSLVSRADADGDGAATEAEILALMTAEAAGPEEEEQPESEADDAASDDAGDGGARRRSTPLMTALDADQDGEVSAAEIGSAAQSLRSLDADGDGRLTPDELLPPAEDEESNGADG